MSDGGRDGTSERALELLVYGPVGLLCYMRDTAPTFLRIFVARGRTEVERRRGPGEPAGPPRSVGDLVGSLPVPDVRRVVADGVCRARDVAGSVIGMVTGQPTEPERRPPAPTPRDRAAPPEAPAARRRPHVTLAIPDYDELSASQVVDRLEGLRRPDLEAIRAYEAAHRGRNTILGKIDQLTATA